MTALYFSQKVRDGDDFSEILKQQLGLSDADAAQLALCGAWKAGADSFCKDGKLNFVPGQRIQGVYQPRQKIDLRILGPESSETLSASLLPPKANTEEEFSWLQFADNASLGVGVIGTVAAVAALGALAVGAPAVTMGLTMVLANPVVDAAFLATGLWGFARSLPHTAEAAGRLGRVLTGDYPTNHSIIEDTLTIAMAGVSAMGLGVHLNSWRMGAKCFASARKALAAEGHTRLKILEKADAQRKAARDIEYAVNRLREDAPSFFNRNLIRFLKISRPTVTYSPILAGATFAHQGYLFATQDEHSPRVSGAQLMMAGLGALAGIGPAASMRLYEKARAGQISRPQRTEEHDEALLLKNVRQEKVRNDFVRETLLPAKERLGNATVRQPLELAGAGVAVLRAQFKARSLDSELGRRLRRAAPQLSDEPPDGSPLKSRQEVQRATEDKIKTYSDFLTEIEGQLKDGRLPKVADLAEAQAQTPLPSLNGQALHYDTKRMASQKMGGIRELLDEYQVDSLDALYAVSPKQAVAAIYDLSIEEYRMAYTPDASGKRLLRAETVAKILLSDADWDNRALFPRSGDRAYERRLVQWAKESDARWDNQAELRDANGHVWDGIPFGLKDLYLNHDGQTTLGSIAAKVTGEASYLAKTMRSLGALEVPVGATAGGMGGTSRDVAGRYIHNPYPKEFQTFVRDGVRYTESDLGGSSGPSVAVLTKLPFSFGTDTGGSCKVPAAVAPGVSMLVPAQDLKSRQGLIPLDPNKDHTGIFSKRDPETVYQLAAALNPEEWSLSASPTSKPTIAYIQEDFDKAPMDVQESFLASLNQYAAQGLKVVALKGEAYRDVLGKIQCELYAPSAYPNSAFTAMNPAQKAPLGEPPRYGTLLDANNGRDRLLRAEAYLPFYEDVTKTIGRLQEVVREVVGENAILALTAPQRVPTAWMMDRTQGASKTHVFVGNKAGEALDGHDYNTMISNFNPDWETFMLPALDAAGIGKQILWMGPASPLRSLAKLLTISPATADLTPQPRPVSPLPAGAPWGIFSNPGNHLGVPM